jgi:hypothetical protein
MRRLKTEESSSAASDADEPSRDASDAGSKQSNGMSFDAVHDSVSSL